MSVSVITVGTQSVNLVSLPTTPAPASVQFDMADAVATVRSTFTGQMQAQGWPGADALSGTVTMPPLTQAQADDWIAFLMELRGMANAFQIGDPMKSTPRGTGGALPPRRRPGVNRLQCRSALVQFCPAIICR